MVKINLTDEDLDRTPGNYFTEGVHKVKIDSIERDNMDDGRAFLTVKVTGEDDQEGTARLWLHTEGGAKYSLSILSGIVSHSKKTEADKAKVRESFKAINDTDELDSKFLARFKGLEAWYEVEKTDRTYTNADGETKNSYNRNVYGYEPKPKKVTVEDIMGGAESISSNDIPFGD